MVKIIAMVSKTDPTVLSIFLNPFPDSLRKLAEHYLYTARNCETNTNIILRHVDAVGDIAKYTHHCAMRIVTEGTSSQKEKFDQFEAQLVKQDGYHVVRTFKGKETWKETRIYSKGPDIVSQEEGNAMIEAAKSGNPIHHVAVFYTVYDLDAIKLPDKKLETVKEFNRIKTLLLRGVNGEKLTNQEQLDVLLYKHIPYQIKANFLTGENGTINHFAVLTIGLETSHQVMLENGAIPNKKQIGLTMNQLSNYCDGNYVEVVELKPGPRLSIDMSKVDGNFIYSEKAKTSEDIVVLTNFTYSNAEVLFKSTEKAVVELIIQLSETLNKTVPKHVMNKIKELIQDNIPIDGFEK